MTMRTFALAILFLIDAASARTNPLQLAIAKCDFNQVTKLLSRGEDPNAKDFQGQPILRWFASHKSCGDSAALATIKLLDKKGLRYENSSSGPSLLIMIATRDLPETLEFLTTKNGAGDPTQALKAIARRGNLKSARVLLAAGADPLIGDANSSALLDATIAEHVDLVREMLKVVQDKQSRKVIVAFEYADHKGLSTLVQLFIAAGVKPPTAVVAKGPLCKPREMSPAQFRISQKLNLDKSCRLMEVCGDLILIDCNSAADGPAYYVNQNTGAILATCGGACMRGCTGCPPQGWTCECRL